MQTVALLISIGIAQGAGILGVFFMGDSLSSWYLELAKPSWNPPSYVFGPVWTVLYTLMGIAAYLVWRSDRTSIYRKRALLWYGIQLVLNGLWTPLFFGVQNPTLAFLCIVALWVSIVITMMYCYRVNVKAFALLIPYLAWVSFATALNLAIVLLNP